MTALEGLSRFYMCDANPTVGSFAARVKTPLPSLMSKSLVPSTEDTNMSKEPSPLKSEMTTSELVLRPTDTAVSAFAASNPPPPAF